MHHRPVRMDALETAVACVAFLGIAALSVVLFTYNVFQLLKDLSGEDLWDRLNNAAAAMCTPAFYHFTMAFLGQRRVRRPSIIAFYAYFALLGVTALGAFVSMRVWGV